MYNPVSDDMDFVHQLKWLCAFVWKEDYDVKVGMHRILCCLKIFIITFSTTKMGIKPLLWEFYLQIHPVIPED
jgi:hypothetical protein